MDLKQFYKRLRQVEGALPAAEVLVYSLATADGGAEGVLTTVAKDIAARLIVEGRARLATAEEAESFAQEQEREREELRRELAERRLNLHVMSDEDLRALKGKRG